MIKILQQGPDFAPNWIVFDSARSAWLGEDGTWTRASDRIRVFCYLFQAQEAVAALPGKDVL